MLLVAGGGSSPAQQLPYDCLMQCDTAGPTPSNVVIPVGGILEGYGHARKASSAEAGMSDRIHALLNLPANCAVLCLGTSSH